MKDIDRLRLAIDKWGQALIMEIQLLREAIVAQNISICESCANNPCNKKAMLGDRRIYECTMYEQAEQTEPKTYCKKKNCVWWSTSLTECFAEKNGLKCKYKTEQTEQTEREGE